MDWQVKKANFNQLIKQLFHDDDPENRSKAARQLGFLKDGRAVNLLCRALKSEFNDLVLNRIIEALGMIGDAKATLGIIEKLNEEIKTSELGYDKLRITFILESLKRIKDKRALPILSKFLTSSDDQLKRLTEQIFDEIEPNWRQIIEKQQRKKSLEEMEKQHIIQVLKEHHGNISRTAEVLGINRVTLYRKIKEYNIQTDNSAE
ncbi:MAG: helix-turn-helix domain-containing protein [Candidatus Thorarchaeota archaeon]